MYGRNKNDEYVLPSDLESAFKQWRANASPEERAEVPIEEDLRYERPGYYRPITPEIQMEQGSAMPGWFDEAHKGIIIGTDLCARRTKDGSYNRYHFRGEKVVLTMVPMSDVGTIRDATGMPWEFFRYIDDCRTGVYEIDSKSVYVDFDSLQPILQMHETEEVIDVLDDGTPVTRPIPARTTQIQIKLTEEVDGVPVDPIATRDLIAERWLEFARSRLDQVRAPMLQLDVEVKTWEEKQANFIGAVEKEKYLVTILFGIISLVAVLLVGCIFYMIVQQKTRDIGIIKSVGATAAGVAQIFLAYGAAVGVVGGAIGIVIGAIFVRYINEIQELLIKIHPSAQIWNPEVYSFDRIPSHVDVGDAIVIYVIAIGASMLGSLIAAWRAARVWPVEALRYE
jgi:lipoprotein-releasing system permease protein